MDNQRLRLLVEEARTTQKEIAASLGLSQQRFNYYVTGQREPDAAMLCAIADYFGVSVDYLLGRQNEKKPTPVDGGGLSETNMRLVTWFRSLPEEKQKAILIAQDAPEGLL